MTADLLSALKSHPRIVAALSNSPPIRMGEVNGSAVALIQDSLVLLGYPMPASTTPSDVMDGIFGNETATIVRKFQAQQALLPDAIVGHDTLYRLFDLIATKLSNTFDKLTVLANSKILQVGMAELGVSWKVRPERVKEYFQLSADLSPNPDARLTAESRQHMTSWCSFFVHWVLDRVGAKKPLLRKANLRIGDSVSRYVDTYMTPLGRRPFDFMPGKYEPQAGDMYSMPNSPLSSQNPVNHIGFVIGRAVPGDRSSPIVTLDGNSITPATLALWLGGKGGGMVCQNERQERPWISFYIPNPVVA